MLIVCLQLIEKIKNDFIGAECIVLNATREGYELYKNIGGFEELDDEYRLPDLYENKSPIKMYRSIESKAN